MSGDKSDALAFAPEFDLGRLIHDLGGAPALSRIMCEAGFGANWGLKTLQARRRRLDMRIARFLEVEHVFRLRGRIIRFDHYITRSHECQYPPSSSLELPQPVPVSQRQE
jgi:hypothetical protein